MSDDNRRRRSADHGGIVDENVALERSLEEASASIEAARSLLHLRKTVGRSLRAAIRCLLEAQEKIEIEGPSAAARLDLLEAIRLVGTVEQELKGVTPQQIIEQAESFSAARDKLFASPLVDDDDNRRAFQRLPAAFSIELAPEHGAGRSDLTTLPLNGVTLNVSKGGMLAKIDQGILRHGRYMIRFLKADASVSPEITWGAVRRSRARNRGWEVGIEFDDPLDRLK